MGGQRFSRAEWWTIAGVSAGGGAVWLATSSVSIALPTIQREVGARFSQLQWINSVAFTLAVSALLVFGGDLADRLGRRRVLAWGLGAMALASAACGFADSVDLMIAGRALQGVGAALVLPATLAILAAVFPAGRRGLPIGLWAAAASGGQAVGPTVGGFFTGLGLWRWVFWINVPIALFVWYSTLGVEDPPRDAGDQWRPDWLGLTTLSAAVSLLTFFLIQVGDWGWTATPSLVAASACVVLMAAFIAIELRNPAPLVHLEFFRNPLFFGSNVVNFLGNFALGAVLFFLALYLQNVLDYDPWTAGLVFLPMGLLMAALSPFSGYFFDRLGPLVPVLLSALLYAAGYFLGLGFALGYGFSALFVMTVFIGVGNGFQMPGVSAGVVYAVPPAYTGQAAGVMKMGSMLGGTLGVAIGGAMFQIVSDNAFLARLNAAGIAVSPELARELEAILSGTQAARRDLAAMGPELAAKVTALAKESFTAGLVAVLILLAAISLFTAVISWFTVRRRYFYKE